MKSTNLLFFVILFFFINQLYAQYLDVKFNDMPVGGEEWIAINPKNPNQLVTGTHFTWNTQSNMGYFYSTNGGLNWSGHRIYSTVGQPGADPIMLVDTSGYFYFICIADWGVPLPNLDKLICFKSTNGGINWDNGTAFAQVYPKYNDMPMACVDFSHSQYSNSIYVTWTLFDSLRSFDPNDSCYVYFCKSTDAGSTFSTPKRISKIAGIGYWDIKTPEGPVPSTGINGEVYVCYPYDELILFNRSTDGGNTWLNNEIVACNQPGGWGPHCSPVITCDLSESQFKGTVYICFSDLRNGMNDRDIWVIKSTNNGNNWSSPVRVNSDPSGNNQDLPWICVDRVTGFIWIVFYDGRNYSNGTRFDTYVARSTDGGSTFQNVKVSNSYSYALTQFWLGDYIGIAAYNNKIRPVWTTSLGYNNSFIWTAIIDTFTIGIQPINKEVPDRFLLHQNYPNPFNPITTIKFDIPLLSHLRRGAGGMTSLKVYDILGKEIVTIVNEKLQSGTYEVTFDAGNLSSGVYYYRIYSGDYSDTKKMLMIK